MNRKSELAKNLRIKVDIPNSLDYMWGIDVKKSQAKVPSKLAKNLLSAISDGENVSKKVNTFKGTKEVNSLKSIWNLIKDRDDEFYLDLDKKHPLYLAMSDSLNSDQQKLFKLFMDTVLTDIPFYAIYSEIASGNKSEINRNEELLEEFIESYETLKSISGFDLEDYLKDCLINDKYKSDELITKFIEDELEKLKHG